MLIQASKILTLPVAALDTKNKIGSIKDLIVDPTNGELIGLIISLGWFFKTNKILSSHDILEFDRNGVVTKNEDCLVEASEIVRAKKTIDQKIKVLGQKALTESGRRLGKIGDLLIDTDTSMVVKYYISTILEDRILPADKVVRIEKQAVIFSDDVIDETPAAEAEGAVA